ncbi:hypothetical protein ABT354_26880 [Streptomyces sp. NPDC000594]|uniref:hypothetical protein n=1 Tax=Streptomyces sp. NPDC000594 TaxID=3154261 RepID=UPI0033276E10
MSDLPLPLPPEHIPAGATTWRTADARRWSAARPARWAHPLISLAVLVAGALWAIVSEPEAACTPARPCDAEWASMSHFALLLITLYWIWRQPRLALLAQVVLAADSLFRLTDPDTVTGTGEWGFLAALAFSTAALAHRLGVIRRQRALAVEAAGPERHPLPPPVGRLARGRFSLLVAVVLLALSGGALWQAGQEIDAYEERAARGGVVSAQVVRVDVRDDDRSPLLVETDDNQRHTVGTDYPEDHPVGSRVALAVDGEWVRLVSEPYDIVGWQLMILAMGLPGLAFLANGLTGRHRSRALDRGPLPVLKVLVREDESGLTCVYAADDPTGERPLLTFHSLYSVDDDDNADADAHSGDPDAVYPDEAEEAEEERMRRDAEQLKALLKGDHGHDSPLREAVLYGAPYHGAEVVLLAPATSPSPEGEIDVERSVSPVRPVGHGSPRPSGGTRRGTTGRRDRRRSLAEIAAGMEPSPAPRSWSADAASRGVGLFLLLVQGGGVWTILDDKPSWWQWLLALLVLPTLVNSIATGLNWRLTADRDGIWVAGPWRVRHIPWDSVTGVRHRPDTVEITVSGGKDVELSPVGFFWLQRKLGRESSALDAAETLRLLADRPDLRPERQAVPAEQGAPLGPVIVVVAAVWAAVVLLLL